jgi:hypothetical protein
MNWEWIFHNKCFSSEKNCVIAIQYTIAHRPGHSYDAKPARRAGLFLKNRFVIICATKSEQPVVFINS